MELKRSADLPVPGAMSSLKRMEKMHEIHQEELRQFRDEMNLRARSIASQQLVDHHTSILDAKQGNTGKGGTISRWEMKEKLSTDTDSLEAELRAIGAMTENLGRAPIIKARPLNERPSSLQSLSGHRPAVESGSLLQAELRSDLNKQTSISDRLGERNDALQETASHDMYTSKFEAPRREAGEAAMRFRENKPDVSANITSLIPVFV
jgi:hypothetical protein